MSEQNQSEAHFCPSCGGHVKATKDPTAHLGEAVCMVCGATIRYKGFEMKVEGHPDDVKKVSQHLLNQAVEAENVKSNNKSKRGIMGLFKMNNKVKCRRFYEDQSRVIDITGLKAGIPQKFNFGLGSFKIDTKYHEANEQLQKLDILQYGLCNDINGISDQKHRDILLEKIIETKTRMLEIVIGLNGNRGEEKA